MGYEILYIQLNDIIYGYPCSYLSVMRVDHSGADHDDETKHGFYSEFRENNNNQLIEIILILRCFITIHV